MVISQNAIMITRNFTGVSPWVLRRLSLSLSVALRKGQRAVEWKM